MQKKYKKLICLSALFFVFLFAGFFCLSANKTFAAQLEVTYPTIAGQSITGDTKLPAYVSYLFYAGMFLGFFSVFISLIIAGVMYLFSAVNVDKRADAKDRVGGAISGLLVLVLTYLIITTINPQLSFFKLTELPPAPPPPAETKAPGVYFYKGSSNCTDPAKLSTTSNVLDFGPTLKNQINSVGIVNDSESYISILYNNPNLWGKCLYLNPNKPCQPAVDSTTGKPFASSASVYRYDPSPNGDGVYFFRKPCFNKIISQYGNMTGMVNSCKQESGGYFKISNSEINSSGNSVYIKKLDDLCFTNGPDCASMQNDDCNVPKEEQDCIKYDTSGVCTQRDCPTLGGENLSSVLINGDYLVLFVYFGPDDEDYGPWSSCQEFSAPDDVNKLGPQQLKWENIRKNGSFLPNYVVIIPIKR
ncbi:MAG: hypothetical protein NTW11_03575 [Candidatus Staskawiczbacteria bacterium]|nr:hypothetical protein [Candidatus Staskawiczbacteria bacterium]